jgi:glutathione peroxidase-family protein
MKKQILIVVGMLVVGGVFSTYFFKKVDAAELPNTKTPEALGYNVGDFKLKNINGKMVSLADFTSAKGFIVVFTSNHCPFSKSYEDRIVALDNKYALQGFPVIAINPNDPEAYEEDSFANMQARAKEKGYTYPYLADDTQTVSKMFGAIRTPQIYVLRKEGGKIIVSYLGAIDDNAQDPSGVTKRYVEDAVNNLLAGKPVVTTITKAIGCAIKWKS